LWWTIGAKSPIPTGDSLYQHKPGRLEEERKEFRALVEELEKLSV
jgi:hypothetical protein